MVEKNWKSDFDFLLTLTVAGVDIGVPNYDWEAVFTTSGATKYIASCHNGIYTNSINDNGHIRIIMDNHKLGCGQLKCEFIAYVPDGIYPDGTQVNVAPTSLEITLVQGQGDDVTSADAQMAITIFEQDCYEIAVKYGYSGTQAEYYNYLVNIPIMSDSVNKAISDVNNAIVAVDGAVDIVNTASQNANKAVIDTENAIATINKTNDRVNVLATQTEKNTQNVENLIIKGNDTISRAETAITNTNVAIANTNNSASKADTSASSANTAANNANTAATKAKNAATDAYQINAIIEQNEKARNINEGIRQSNETERETTFNELSQDCIDAADKANASASNPPKIINEDWYIWDSATQQYINTNEPSKGEKGDKGDDGDVPLLRITNNIWEVSYDNGTSWSSINAPSSALVRINSSSKVWETSTDNGVTWISTGVSAISTNATVVQTVSESTDDVPSCYAVTNAKKLLFRDMWNSGCGSYGKFNTATGYYELNGLTNITYEQALRIYNIWERKLTDGCYLYENIRTNMPVWNGGYASIGYGSCYLAFAYNAVLEKAMVSPALYYINSITNATSMFNNCPNLDEIIGNLICPSFPSTFSKCYKLRKLYVKSLKSDISFSDSPLLNYDSVKYMVDNAANTTAIVITVHATTLSYLNGTASSYTSTGHTKEEWQAIVTSATTKNITFAS